MTSVEEQMFTSGNSNWSSISDKEAEGRERERERANRNNRGRKTRSDERSRESVLSARVVQTDSGVEWRESVRRGK